jgi:hypothetical protein
VPITTPYPVEHHCEVASPQLGFHVDRRIHQATNHGQGDSDIAIPDIGVQTTRRMGSLDEVDCSGLSVEECQTEEKGTSR